MPQDNLCAVILTALPVEFKAVRAFLSDCKEDIHPTKQTVYERGTFTANGKCWDVGIVEIGPGNVDAALETGSALEHFKPQVVLFVGIAGGIKDVKIGDVVAATKIYGYESGKAEAGVFKPRPEVGESSYSLVQRARAEARNSQWLQRLSDSPNRLPDAYVRPIAAGEKVVASTQTAVCNFLQHHYSDAVAVEMEGYGFIRAAYSSKQTTSAIVIRGISDLLDNKNEANNNQAQEEVRQATASHHASAFAFQLLTNFEPCESFVDKQTSVHQVRSQVWDELFAYFKESDLPIIAPLCQQIFEDELTLEQRDPYSELSQLDTLETLKTVFKRRDDLSLAVKWVGLVIQSFENPLEGTQERSVPSGLRGFFNVHKPSHEEEEEVKSEKKQPSSYLLIALDPKDDEDMVGFTAELHSTDSAVPENLFPEGGIQCSLDEPHEDLCRYLSEAFRKAKQVKTIEFFLSWRHFDQPVHDWKVKVDAPLPLPLKLLRNTLVRSLDRLTQEDFVDERIETLETQWDRLQGCCAKELIKSCHEVFTLDCEALAGELLGGDEYIIFKLLSALPTDKQELEQLLSIVVWSGIPIWFWSYCSLSGPDKINLSIKINDFLSADNLQNSATFAEIIKKNRKSVPNLGLLCDCPTRLPVLVDWKNGRLRQPAA
ncbi:phosphorylase family protein [Leptothoe kymatousa]|uniref:5'-methylthioadenosine/S-adenosylhomocysteine nucleosidase n=1 Tax=Leptothoe kymatousa TAU-MAC 1615 TaxID=2364775 RepID=A0ABS5XYX1_9CYAN|nr:5'-methylthioadenosine/S-adenosylhomocysteine nucleosidase [Leptothoe kymatousa]MBT9310822.1 5'-methylthioadenosine/S-adenosylhomocysteine nucleosidase [Leptothoe kymatousa TAU-MAC 1615]